MGGKNLRISELSGKFRLNFRTNRVKLIQNNENSGQGRLYFSHSFKIAPPPLFQILATRLIVFTSFKKQLPNQNRSLVAVAMIRRTKAVQRDIPQSHNTDETEKLRRAYSITNSKISYAESR